MESLEFFVVVNSEGKYFRRKGYGGSGDTWVTSITTARVWTKITGARATVTFFGKTYPQYPVPKIIKMTVSKSEEIDETARVAKVIEKDRIQRENAGIIAAKLRLKEAEAELQRAQEKYEKAKRT